MKNVLVFNSGSGSGFEVLARKAQTGELEAKIVGLVTDSEKNQCIERAEKLGISWCVMRSFTTPDYYNIVSLFKADFCALSGWLKFTRGLDPRTTFNIHPGPLPKFGGKGMWGHHVHEAVIKDEKQLWSEISMHFVIDSFEGQITEKDAYDKGPLIFRFPVWKQIGDTAESLGKRVNTWEHRLQWIITNLVVTNQIFWDGKNLESLVVPEEMKIFLNWEHPKEIEKEVNTLDCFL